MYNLLATLRDRELETAAKSITVETGLTHRSVPKASASPGSTAAACSSPVGVSRCFRTAANSVWFRGAR